MEKAVLFVAVALIQFDTILAYKDCPTRCLCLSTTVRCTRKGLRSFPDFIPPTTLMLLAENNRINSISALNSSSLQTISLHNNRIYNLQPGAFRLARNVNDLNLAENRLRWIRRGVFSQLGRLRKLDLSQNNITKIFSGALDGLIYLSDLYLSNNHILKIPQKLFASLGSLKRLRLDGNSIMIIADGTFLRQNSLISLNLQNNNIRQITAETFRGMASLQKLLLSGNQIRSLDPQIQPPRDDCIKLSNSSREVVSDPHSRSCFYFNKNLQIIDLSNNSLITLRYLTFSRLRMLNKLSLQNNKWRCDCFLVWVLIRLRRDRGDGLDSLRCWEPTRLAGVSIHQFTEQDLSIGLLPGRAAIADTPVEVVMLSDDPTPSTTAVKKQKNTMEIHTNRATSNPIRFKTTSTYDELATKSQVYLTTTSAILDRLAGVSELVLTPTPRRPMAKTLPPNARKRHAAERAVTARLPDAGAASHMTKVANHNPESRSNAGSDTEIEYDAIETNERAMSKSKHPNDGMYPHYTNYGIHDDARSHDKMYRTHQDDVLSWLLVAGMFSVVFVMSICGAMVLKWRFKPEAERCGCCIGKREVTRQPTSESIRSISNYPLLYDNPLARRPLPRQPIQSSDRVGRVDVRWTNGGSFGLGGDLNMERGLAGNRRLVSLSDPSTPPMVPPRSPVPAQSWDERYRGKNGVPNSSRQSASYPSHAIWNSDSTKKQLRQTLSVDDAVAENVKRDSRSVVGAVSLRDVADNGGRLSRNYSEKRCSGRSRKRSKRDRKSRPESMFCAANTNVVDDFILIPSAELNSNIDLPCASAPVSRQSSSISSATYRISKRGKKDNATQQMLEALQEIETSKRNTDFKDLNFRKSCTGQDSEKLPLKRVFGQHADKSQTDGCLTGSISTRRLTRGSSARFSRENPATSGTDGFCAKSGNGHRRPRRSQSVRAQPSVLISELDFQFPPPPRCADYADVTANQTDSNSEDSSTPCASNTKNEYSMLSMCSSGVSREGHTEESKKGGKLVLEQEYRSAKRKYDPRYKRKESSDSLFVAVDSEAESPNLSDSDPEVSNITQFGLKVPTFTPLLQQDWRSKSRNGTTAKSTCSARNNLNFQENLSAINRLSRLDLSLSESSSECSFTLKRPTPDKGRNDTLSTGSLTDVKPFVENSCQVNIPKSIGRKRIESSVGSESVSSFEMSVLQPGNESYREEKSSTTDQIEPAYQSLHLMYSGHMPESERIESANNSLDSTSSVDLKKVITKEEKNEIGISDHKKRCYFDSVESSADDVSTDIEVFDLGTM